MLRSEESGPIIAKVLLPDVSCPWRRVRARSTHREMVSDASRGSVLWLQLVAGLTLSTRYFAKKRSRSNGR